MTNLTLRETARRLDLHPAGRDYRGRCPGCGYGNDAFILSLRDGKILGWCANCQDSAAVVAILRGAGALPPPSHAPSATRAGEAERLADSIERARQLRDGAEPITPGCPAYSYLEGRRIAEIAGSDALRWRPDTPHPGGGRRLALLASVSDVAGKFCGIQRIFITPAGRKADVDPVKATLGAIAGGAIRLHPCSAELAIAEGLESAASAGMLLSMPAWAAISAGNLARSMMLPAEVRSVVIAADADDPGERAAREAAWRWQAEGRTVRIARPMQAGRDFNDIARESSP